MSNPRYRLELEALPGAHGPDYRLKRLLKLMLRSFGFRCRHVALIEEGEDSK